VLDDYRLLVRPGFPEPNLAIYLLGTTRPELGGSQFAEVVLRTVSGRPPALDLDAEGRLHRLLQEGARRDVFASCHDLSDGGLAVGLAESAIAGRVGFTVALPEDGGLAPHVALFSESASRALVTARPGQEGEVERLAAAHRVPVARLGLTGGARLEFVGAFEVPLEDAILSFETAIPSLMRGAAVSRTD
jgi:phosphoribosylformylglycinamidine synthase